MSATKKNQKTTRRRRSQVDRQNTVPACKEEPRGQQSVLWSLCIGLPFPLLFALYSVYAHKVAPSDEVVKRLAGIQIACLAMGATAIAGFLSLAMTNRLETVGHQIRNNLWDILWLNVFTVLGPPLYFIAVVLLGAEPANWIDLGMAPLLTMSAALWLWSISGCLRPGRMVWAGALLAIVGLVFVIRDIARGADNSEIEGVICAVASAIGTAGAGIFLRRIQGRKDAIPSVALLPIRYGMPTLILAAFWVAEGWRLNNGHVVIASDASWFVLALLGLYVLPNYLYVVVVKKKGLLYSGVMWAMLPVFSSIAGFVLGRDETSMGIWTTVIAGILIVAGAVVCDIGSTEEPE